MGNVWQEPTVEILPWPDILAAEADENDTFNHIMDDDEKEFSDFLTED